jgi:pyridoxamine 5'-phosphate oxidase
VDKKEILAFITANPFGCMATVDMDNKARVRAMHTFRADEKGLLFYTAKTKDVNKQLSNNPEVEICYLAKGTQVRVSGRLELENDIAIKKEITEARPLAKQSVEREGWDFLVVYRLKKGKATTFTAMNQEAPKTYIDF